MRTTLLVLAALLVIGCGGNDEPPPPEKAPEGRAETRSIRNTEAVGYDGKRIADQVDATLDANDRRVQQTEQAADE